MYQPTQKQHLDLEGLTVDPSPVMICGYCGEHPMEHEDGCPVMTTTRIVRICNTFYEYINPTINLNQTIQLETQ